MELSENDVTISQHVLTSANDVQDECSICYEPFTNKVYASDCLHSFCYHCISTWVQLRATCPLCLQSITAVITNVRALDDYDIEIIDPPVNDIFNDYAGDMDFVFDNTDSESIFEESVSMVSDLEILQDFEDFENAFSDSNEILQSPSQLGQESLSTSHNSILDVLDDYCSEEEDESSDDSSSENLDGSNSEEDEEEDKDDNDENDENNSENENEEFHEDNDEDYDYDYDDDEYSNNDEDDYEGDDDGDYYEDNVNFSDYDEDNDSDAFDSFKLSSIQNYSAPMEYNAVVSFAYLQCAVSSPENDDTDSDQDYISSTNSANLVYSSSYY